MPLTLLWKGTTSLPVEAECLRPDSLASLSSEQIARLPLSLGNRLVPVGDLFTIEGNASDGHLVLEGHLENLSRLGEGMTEGRMTIRGNAGASLASGQAGGLVEVLG
ncbi:MAG TPA: formylmethanofuran dehydrogenase subunit C, partial [Isosphaeraceae bacterium]|nr:formylmethanofuran dehydrogenase subunit C [Isosphaeraceae bacterium]